MKTIEEHSSGVNQMLKLNSKEILTASDDCTLKFWSTFNYKVDYELCSETITCVAITGQKKEIIVAGCHSGNLILVNSLTKI